MKEKPNCCILKVDKTKSDFIYIYLFDYFFLLFADFWTNEVTGYCDGLNIHS